MQWCHTTVVHAGIPPSIVAIIMYAPHHTHGVGVLTFIIFVLITNIIGWSIPAYLWVAACGALRGRRTMLISCDACLALKIASEASGDCEF